MSSKEAATRVATEYLKHAQDETKSVLDELRRSRHRRGGTGAPLEIPTHLRSATTVTPTIIKTEMGPVESLEERRIVLTDDE